MIPQRYRIERTQEKIISVIRKALADRDLLNIIMYINELNTLIYIYQDYNIDKSGISSIALSNESGEVYAVIGIDSIYAITILYILDKSKDKVITFKDNNSLERS